MIALVLSHFLNSYSRQHWMNQTLLDSKYAVDNVYAMARWELAREIAKCEPST